MDFLLRALKWLVGLAALGIVLLLLPVGYVETFCKANPEEQSFRPLITEPEFQRAEANTYLTYPEWHIVYAYEGLAHVLATDDEHAFGYLRSVTSFWSSFCALNQQAGRHGGADGATRSTIHVIGVSFTLEMAMKAAYEETLGHLFALVRGPDKTPQDLYAARMAEDYGRFLHQTPWYKYDFQSAIDGLWAEPVDSARGWERRLALGGEWEAKVAYASAIEQAVMATGEAKLTIRSVVRGLAVSELTAIPGVAIIQETPAYLVIETPRYRAFTDILRQIADRGGMVSEIAGNDDIMVSVVTDSADAEPVFDKAEVISRIHRDGFAGDRLLLKVTVADLAALFAEVKAGQVTLEHVYDY